MDAEVSMLTFLTMIIEESLCFMSCEPIFCGIHGIYIFFFHPPYSKLKFQGNIFFTQNWCNITLSVLVKQFKHKNGQFFRLITEWLVTLTTINYILIWFLVFNATFCFSNMSSEVWSLEIESRKCLRKFNFNEIRTSGYQPTTCLNPRNFILLRCLKCSLPFKPRD
jgi:hypothetical protein